jgi:hypothetical protein
MPSRLSKCCIDQLFPFFHFHASRKLCQLSKEFYAARNLKSNIGLHFENDWAIDDLAPQMLKQQSIQSNVILRNVCFKWTFCQGFLSLRHLQTLKLLPPLSLNQCNLLLTSFSTLLRDLEVFVDELDMEEMFKKLPKFSNLQSLVVRSQSFCFADLMLWEPDQKDPHFCSTLKKVKLPILDNQSYYRSVFDLELLMLKKHFPCIEEFALGDNYSGNGMEESMVNILQLKTMTFSSILAESCYNVTAFPSVKHLIYRCNLFHPYFKYPNVTDLDMIVSNNTVAIPESIQSLFPVLVSFKATLNTVLDWESFQNLQFLSLYSCVFEFTPTLLECKGLQDSLISLKICQSHSIVTREPTSNIGDLRSLSNMKRLKSLSLERIAAPSNWELFSFLKNPPASFNSLSLWNCYHIDWLSLSSARCIQSFSFLGATTNVFKEFVYLFLMMEFLKELKVDFVHQRKGLRAHQEECCPQLCLEFQ